MSSIVVSSTNPITDNGRRAGMRAAGRKINKKIMKPEAQLPWYNVPEAFLKELEDDGFYLFYFHDDGEPYRLTNRTVEITNPGGEHIVKVKYEYTASGATQHLTLRFKRDRDFDNPNRHKMVISLPRDRGNLLVADNYITEIGTDIRGENNQTRRDRYILGNIFMSKCR